MVSNRCSVREGPTRVLLEGSECTALDWLVDGSLAAFEVRTARSVDDLQAALTSWAPDVIIARRTAAVARVSAYAGPTPPAVLLADALGPQSKRCKDPVGVFYRFSVGLGPEEVCALLMAASARARGTPVAHPPSVPDAAKAPEEARRLHRVLRATRRVAAQHGLSSLCEQLVSSAIELTSSQRGYCWFNDAESGELWRHRDGLPDLEINACSGVVGFVARTGIGAAMLDVAADSRYSRDTDDPGGRGDEQLLAQPLIGSDGNVHAVVVVVREDRSGTYDANDHEALRTFANCVGLAVHQLAIQLETQTVLERPVDGGLFRPEAVEVHARSGAEGDVVRVSPSWVRYAYVSVLAFMLVGVAGITFGQVDQYSTGPAVVRVLGRGEVTATLPGTVEQIDVEVGDVVEEGAVVARLYGADEDAQTERIDRDVSAALRKKMLDPLDPGADQALRSARQQQDEALEARNRRLIRAPHGGVISDIRVRVGQALAPGDVVASLVTDRDELGVIAVLPGSDRPMLAPGLRMRLQVHGYAYAYNELVIDSVSEEVVGAAEVRRALGPIADSLAPPSSAVIVRAHLPATTFAAGGENYSFHDGMPAVAEVQIKRRSVIQTLLPGLDQLEVFR